MYIYINKIILFRINDVIGSMGFVTGELDAVVRQYTRIQIVTFHKGFFNKPFTFSSIIFEVLTVF